MSGTTPASAGLIPIVADAPIVLSADQRRARLLEVARYVIAHEGLGACTFRRLASAAGTSTAPFTSAFGTRDALLHAVALDAVARLAPGAAVEDDGADWSCTEALMLLGGQWLPVADAVAEDQRVYLEILVHSLRSPGLHGELDALGEAVVDHAAEIIQRGRADGQVASDQDPRALAAAIVALMTGLAMLALSNPALVDDLGVHRLMHDGVTALLSSGA